MWTPAGPAAPRPVLVWIHGGAFLSGGSSQAVYDAARLAAESDAVVVTINYRLGALGFMTLDGDAATNCGLRDQFAALAWVRENIGAFGGDPDRVTVFGESAGAGAILQLLASPRRGTAFRRAVIQSCEPKVLTPEQAGVVAKAFLEHLGLARPDLGRLRALPIEAVLEAQAAAFVATMAAADMMPFHPVRRRRRRRRTAHGRVAARSCAATSTWSSGRPATSCACSPTQARRASTATT